MTLAKRVALLRLRKTLPVVEAAYIVVDKLGGMWDDAVSLLTETIDAGDLKAQIVPKRNPWHGTIIGAVDESQTTVAMADLLHWLDGIARAAPAPQNDAEKDDATEKDWRPKARDIADECFDRDTANNCRDSLASYSHRVMDEMQKRNIHGPQGPIVNPKTIQREALQGAKWWQNKPK